MTTLMLILINLNQSFEWELLLHSLLVRKIAACCLNEFAFGQVQTDLVLLNVRQVDPVVERRKSKMMNQ